MSSKRNKNRITKKIIPDVDIVSPTQVQKTNKIKHLFSFVNKFGLILSIIVSIFTIPILLENYIYKPNVTFREQEVQIVEGEAQLIVGILNKGSKPARNVRLLVLTPNMEKTYCVPNMSVNSIITKAENTVAVDIPSLPVDEFLTFVFFLPESLYVTPDKSGKYFFSLANITAENTIPV